MEGGAGNWGGLAGLRAEDRAYSGEGTLWTKLLAKTQTERFLLGQKEANHATAGTVDHNPGTDAAGARVCGMLPNTQWTVHVCVEWGGKGGKRDSFSQYCTDTEPV